MLNKYRVTIYFTSYANIVNSWSMLVNAESVDQAQDKAKFEFNLIGFDVIGSLNYKVQRVNDGKL